MYHLYYTQYNEINLKMFHSNTILIVTTIFKIHIFNFN